MDPKASAKSKRIHSRHGRKNHPSPSANAQKKKQQQQQHRPVPEGSVGGEAKPKRQSGPSLPSNWDRYDNEDGAEIEVDGEKSDGPEAKSGEVAPAPKSKGADFRHLIEEARSQNKEHRQVGLAGSSSIEQLPFDFMQGLSSMLSVKGEALLALCQDDNFIIDDDPTSSSECQVPFLSLDLHAITEHLSKLKPSQRLFIEDDLLPAELFEESKKDQVCEKSETITQFRTDDGRTSPAFFKETVSEHNVGGKIDPYMFNSEHDMKMDKYSDPYSVQINKLDPFGELNMTDDSQNIAVLGPSSEHGMQLATNPGQNRMPKFETTIAEAELDMLLDSQIETNISRTHLEAPSDNTATRGSLMLDSLTSIGSASVGQDTTSSGLVATSFLDEDLDDLLPETSFTMKNKGTTSLTQGGKVYSKNHFPSSDAASTSLRETTYTRHVATSAPLDDAIDDLLAETYIPPEDLLNTAKLQNKETAAANLSSTSPFGQKPVDDFDSWFDTIQ